MQQSVTSFKMDDFADYHLQGVLVQAALHFAVSKAALYKDLDVYASVIKKELSVRLAEGMIEKKLVAFTKKHNINSDSEEYYARAFVLPNDKIQIVRRLKDGRL